MPYLKIDTKGAVEKLVPDLFTKIKVKHIFKSAVWNAIQFVFLHAQVEVYQNVSKLRCWLLAFTRYKSFSVEFFSGAILLASFSAWFSKKNIFHIKFYKLGKFRCPITFISCEIWQYECCNYLCPSLRCHIYLN